MHRTAPHGTPPHLTPPCTAKPRIRADYPNSPKNFAESREYAPKRIQIHSAQHFRKHHVGNHPKTGDSFSPSHAQPKQLASRMLKRLETDGSDGKEAEQNTSKKTLPTKTQQNSNSRNFNVHHEEQKTKNVA